MSFDLKNKAIGSNSKRKVRIGSRVPEENREWLKSHGIVTDKVLSVSSLSLPPQSLSHRFEKPIIVAMAALLCFLPLLWFQQQHRLLSQIELEREKTKNLDGVNYHLRGNLEKISSINLIQQSEINRMAEQLQRMTQTFSSKVSGFEKGEAMSDALHHTYANELERMSHQYDLQVDALRRQVTDQDQVISSLEYSLQSINGVVVSADSMSEQGLITNGAIAAVNQEFQFAVIDAGEIKGARVGQMVEIYHLNEVIGYGQIEKIYSEYACVKVSESVLQQIQVGDPVFVHSKA